MPKFVIERHIPGLGKLTPAELKAISLKSVGVLREMGPQIQWLHSYVTEDKLYCVYLAPDEAAVREHARRGGFPADRVMADRKSTRLNSSHDQISYAVFCLKKKKKKAKVYKYRSITNDSSFQGLRLTHPAQKGPAPGNVKKLEGAPMVALEIRTVALPEGTQ